MNRDRIEHPSILDSDRVVADLIRREALGVFERCDSHVLETECVTGGFDVACCEILFAGGLVGVDLKPLHERRVDATHHNRHERPEPDSEYRKGPAPSPQVDDQQHDCTQRDGDQQVQRWKLGIDVGVERPVEYTAGGRRQLISGQPVVQCLDDGQNRQNRREMHFHDRFGPFAPDHADADRSVEVVRDRGDDQHDHKSREGPADHIAQERQLEDVEPDVGTELGIGDPELLAVDEEQPFLPLAGHPRRGEQRKEERNDRAQQEVTPPDGGVVPGDQLLFGAGRSVRGSAAIRDEEVQPHQHEEERAEYQRQDDLGTEHLAPDRGTVERIEPQVVGVEAGYSAQRQQTDDQSGYDYKGDHPPVSTEPSTSWIKNVLNLSHRREG